MSKELFIFGTGGLAKEVTQLVEEINAVATEKYDVKGYVVTKPIEPFFRGKEVSSEEEFCAYLKKGHQANVVVAVGTPSGRRRIINSFSSYDIHYPCLIHPSSRLNPSISLKEGITICANVICTVDIAVGRHTYINFGCSVAHDVYIGEFVQVNPMCAISGRVKIGDNCTIGAGSIILQGIEIGAGSTVGIGSVVLRNVKPMTTVFGNPAKQLPLREGIQNE